VLDLKKSLIIILTIIMTMGLLAACGTSKDQDKKSTSSQGDTKKEKLVMATSADYPPYEDYDTTSGKIIGFDVDVAKYIGSKLNFEVEVKDMDFNGLLPALQSKRADFVMAGMTPKPERKKNADFSDIYFEAKNTIVAAKDSSFKTLEDLKGKKVGVQLGSIQESAVNEVKGIQVVSLNKVPEIIQELKSGRIDAAIIEDTVAKGYTGSNKDLKFTEIPNTELAGSAVAFPKGSTHVDDFNKVLKEMKENGEMDRLVKKWFEAK
jgi:ABC-type amino acid transport substrate-binding protein